MPSTSTPAITELAKLAAFPLRVFARRIERAFHVTIDRPKCGDTRELDSARLVRPRL
jgi:hypothetical protein